MSKTITEAPLTTRAARKQLEPGLHWRSLDREVHIGFRKSARAGRWLVRWRSGRGYKQAALAAADDVLDADGSSTLNFHQATMAARDHVEAARIQTAIEAAGPIETVRSVVEAYLVEREAREASQRPGKPLKRDARSRLGRHVLVDAVFAELPLHELTEAKLRDWKRSIQGLAATSVRRLVNDFKAALNKAADEKRAVLPLLTSTIKSAFKSSAPVKAVARDKQILNDGEVRGVIQAARIVDEAHGWGGDFYRLVLVLAATGARFSQVAALRVGDLHRDRDNARLMLPVSFKGRGEKTIERYAVPVGTDVLADLRIAIARRKSVDPLLERWRFKQVGVTEWVRDRRGPWRTASEMTRGWQKTIEQAGLPADVVPYALRHSSIVSGLRAALPVRLVAALHDTSSAMIEKHYAAFIVDAMTDAARLAVRPLTCTADVTPIREVISA